MVPSGPIPFAPGMLPMMPFAQSGQGKGVQCVMVDKKSLPQGYSMPTFMPDGSKEKGDGSKQVTPNKPEMIGMGMQGPMGGMGVAFMNPQGMPGMSMPGMSGMPGMPNMPGMPPNAHPGVQIAAIQGQPDFYKMLMSQHPHLQGKGP